jgi:hypothetical protein
MTRPRAVLLFPVAEKPKLNGTAAAVADIFPDNLF